MSRINLINKDSHLDGPWWEWYCEKENDDGSIVFGYVQSDGHLIAEETFQEDDC